MYSQTTPTHLISSPSELATRFRDASTPTEANRVFESLREAVRPIFRRAAGGYMDSGFTRTEIHQECLLCLQDAAKRYTPELAAKVSFEGFLGTLLRKHLSRCHHLATIRFSGVGLKLARKVSALARRAQAAGVDRSDTQALFSYALNQGARATILRRQLPLLANPVSIDQPVRTQDGATGARLGDLIAFESDSAAPRDFTPVMRIIQSLPETQRRVIESHYGLSGKTPESLAAIARTERVHACSIAERHERALARLGKFLPKEAA